MTRARTLANFGDGIATADIGDGQITTAKLASGAITSAALPAGSVLQVVSTTKTDAFSSFLASAGRTAITGLSVSITPSSATSKILIISHVSMVSQNVGCSSILKRNSTDICVGVAEGLRAGTTVGSSRSIAGYEDAPVSSFTFLDSPSTTSSTTYSVDIFNTRGTTDTVYVNRGIADINASNTARTASTITAMEIAG